MKKVLLLVALTLLALPSLALADDDDGGGRRHHHRIGAFEFVGAGAAIAAAIALGGYLAIRKRSSSLN